MVATCITYKYFADNYITISLQDLISSENQMSGVDADEEGDADVTVVKWQRLAVVKKVVFVKRPMPLLNRPVSKIG